MNKKCPSCKKEDVRQTHTKGFLEQKVFPLIQLRPYRCSTCRSRFYRFQDGDEGLKRVKRHKRAQEKQFKEFFKPPDEEEFRKLIAEIREAERRVFGNGEEGEVVEREIEDQGTMERQTEERPTEAAEELVSRPEGSQYKH